ncbi:MAG: A/G-specific adenine glycosylase [Proteobacteria bacterium]|nr:A/G-specific adenine glycosylase [Pseudomonadota bacterium]
MSRRLRNALLSWYDAHRRDLPWRRSRDPYAIWVSETMLQQTRVETVIPYYERFLRRFPDVATLAAAEPDRLMELWAGLGYYSRARNLQKAAQQVQAAGGEFPSDAAGWRELPGVGRYTAGAVTSIAFDQPEPIVDGNVARVFSRLFGIREDIRSAPVVAQLWERAAQLARGVRPGDLNQALMELGATLCTPRSPRCLLCPVRRHCDAHAAGDAEALPVKAKKAAPRAMEAVAAWIERGGRTLAVRRPPGGLLGGLWELPGDQLHPGETPQAGLARALPERVGISPTRVQGVGHVEHVFTHRRLRLHVFRGTLKGGRVRLDGFDAHKWLAPGRVRSLPHGAATRKALALLDARP